VFAAVSLAAEPRVGTRYPTRVLRGLLRHELD